jgi:hypothetical protein
MHKYTIFKKINKKNKPLYLNNRLFFTFFIVKIGKNYQKAGKSIVNKMYKYS